MPFRETRINTDAEKASEVGKQRKADTQPSTTFEQRCAKYMPFLITTLTLGGARVIEAVSVTESNTVTALPDHMRHSTDQSLPGPDVPLVKVMPEAVSLPGGSTSSENIRQLWPRLSEAMEKYFEERNHPSTSLRDGPTEAQGTAREETSQSTMETHQGEKGRDPLSSHGEMIETLRSVIDKLNEKQVRERSLLEGASEVPVARTLLTDAQSACQDLCSDTPASVDCIKQCTTPVANDTSACLDVSISDVLAKLEPVPGLLAPNQQVRLNYTLSVQNHCPETIKDVTYHLQGTGECPLSSTFIPAPDTGVSIQSFSANPSSLAPGDSAGVKAGQDTSIISRCETYGAGFRITSSSLPPELSVSISASGTDSTTNVAVSSQEKTFIVLGDHRWVNEQCNQMCPPATDTPSTSATGAPSIVFVHGFKPSLQNRDSSGHDCNQYWGDAMKFLRERGLGDLRTIQYYKGDTNCTNGDETRYSSDLHHNLYNSLCTDYHPGSEGTNDESLYHLSCLFSQYLSYNFGRDNRNVVLVGHSMGGLIMRETLYQMQENAGQGPFPLTIGHVTKAITFNSPHSGTYFGNLPAYTCGGCTQGNDLSPTSDLIKELSTNGRNPQTSGGFTEWTIIGSECDLAVQPAKSSIDMDASHTIVYPIEGRLYQTCYGHNQALHDANLKRDANQFYCDTDNPVNSPCDTDYRKTENTRWSKTGSGRRGLSQLYYSVTGGAERAGSSHRLWLLSTAATAWALLRR